MCKTKKNDPNQHYDMYGYLKIHFEQNCMACMSIHMFSYKMYGLSQNHKRIDTIFVPLYIACPLIYCCMGNLEYHAMYCLLVQSTTSSYVPYLQLCGPTLILFFFLGILSHSPSLEFVHIFFISFNISSFEPLHSPQLSFII